MPRLWVLGSLNLDLVVSGVPLPRAGETVIGGRFETHHGGKGGNQAVAAARALRGGLLEGVVSFLGAVGDDEHGTAAVLALRAESVDVAALDRRPESATGVALIVVAPDGDNQIAVAPGANATVDEARVTAALGGRIGADDVLLASMEVPAEGVLAAARLARAAGAKVVLNPAPATGVTAELLAETSVLAPNEGELASLARAAGNVDGLDGDDATEAAIGVLLGAVPHLTLAVTLGARGVATVIDGTSEEIAGHAVDVVDATGAGDTFAGVLAASLLEGTEFAGAVRRANLAAALSVTAAGARAGMPTRDEIEDASGNR